MLNKVFQNRNGEYVDKDFTYDSTRYLRLLASSVKDNLPELYSTKTECCGCTACYAVCPMSGKSTEIVVNGVKIITSGAITMLPDNEGFLYPVVDALVCIQCKRCLEVCAFKSDIKNKDITK